MDRITLNNIILPTGAKKWVESLSYLKSRGIFPNHFSLSLKNTKKHPMENITIPHSIKTFPI